MLLEMTQPELFATTSLPEGFSYRPDFLASAEEAELLHAIQSLPLSEAEYKQYTAKRRIVSYGGRYDFNRNEIHPTAPIPPFLHPLRERIATWAGRAADEFDYALVTEYREGTQLGWHRDAPTFEHVVGVSLAGPARMRLRPYPPRRARRENVIVLDLEPRSIYSMSGAARWEWQHCISPTRALRYSITFRTRRESTQRWRWANS